MPSRSAPPRRIRRVLAGLAACASVAACTGGGPAGSAELRGASVDVVAVWQDVEAEHFGEVLRLFESRTGATVRYRSTGGEDLAVVLDTLLATGSRPDVVFFPQPGLLARYVRDGVVVPVEDDLAEAVRARYPAVWQRLGSVDGQLYGVWFKASNKSLVWYDVARFEREGIVPPEDLEGLSAVAERFSAGGVAAFAVGADEGWTLTDWFENLYLRTAGPERYDALAERRLPWTDPTVRRALTLFAELLTPEALAGGADGARSASFPQSVAAVFGRHGDPQAAGALPPAAMVAGGDFVAAAAQASGAIVGVDADVFDFPGVERGDRYVVGGGDIAVLVQDSTAGRRMLEFLASAEAAEVWARRGGFLSANEEVDLAAYPDDITRGVARSLLEAGERFRFDLSDLQPAAFGSTTGAGMWAILRDFLAVPDDVDTTMARLEAAAEEAFSAEGGE